MSSFPTIKDFINKVDWEGGISEAVLYGLTEEDIPDDGSDDSRELFRLWAVIRGPINRITEIFGKYDEI